MRESVASAIDYSMLPDRKIVHTLFQKRHFVSYGVMAWCLATRQWLLVRPSHSYSFILYVNGLYRKADLPVMISLMTVDELAILRQLLHGQKDWNEVYRGHFYNETYALFVQTLDKLRQCLATNQGVPKTPWTFPKGRQEHDESVMETAIREFDEETGLSIQKIGRQVDPIPVSESYTSFDHQTYETVCWIYVIDTIPENMVLDVGGVDGEICERCWVTTDQAKQFLTPSKYAMIVEAMNRPTFSKLIN
jgi:hypothetical protein